MCVVNNKSHLLALAHRGDDFIFTLRATGLRPIIMQYARGRDWRYPGIS